MQARGWDSRERTAFFLTPEAEFLSSRIQSRNLLREQWVRRELIAKVRQQLAAIFALS